MNNIHRENSVLGIVIAQIQAANIQTIALVTTSVLLCATYITKRTLENRGQKLPPHIPSSIPFLGQAINFNKSPVEFLVAASQKYGPVFSFTMVGKTFTYLVSSEASALFFNSKNENLNAEEVYNKLTAPVFGKGVAYDCPNSLFLEQKKMLKTGMNIARYRLYIPMMEEETIEYFKRWGSRGEKDIFLALSQLIILTASRCLHGKEIRSIMNDTIAQYYWDMDGGFTPEAWLLPGWFPLPSSIKRDKAHKKMKEIFHNVIQKRRESGDIEEDMLQTLLDSTYKSGRHMTDDEISGMLIGLLLAGQHTSSTTGSWLAFFLAQNPEIQDACYQEQLKVFGENLTTIDYDGLKECQLLDRCLKESLRLRPPLLTMMRMCKSPQKVLGYTIPPGHQVCVSPPTSHHLPHVWKDVGKFKPDRFMEKVGCHSDEKFIYIPFGAGRHRCIGESFAYVQIKAIFSILLRLYHFELINDRFPEINLAMMIHTPKDPFIRYSPRQSEKNCF